MKIFKIIDTNGDSILGNLTESNIYLNIYAQYTTEKTHKNIKIGEEASARFHISSENGFYAIKRIK